MDTDDLSEKTYKAIIIESEKFNPDLTLQFGLLSYQCKDEMEFISKSKILVTEMLEFDHGDMEDIFFETPPSIKEFRIAMKNILTNIQNLD